MSPYRDPEYIDTLRLMKRECNVTNINETVFYFGDSLSHCFDVVFFCGAIIHWGFSLTGDLRNFDSIIEYLLTSTQKYMVIERVSVDDIVIKSLDLASKREKQSGENYNTENFEKAVKKHRIIISKGNVDSPSRAMYVLHKI